MPCKLDIFASEIYNWEELDEEYGFNASSDSELIFKLIEERGVDKIDEIDGVYAFAYQKDNVVYLARDIIGVKPLWYSLHPFVFAPSRKVLIEQGYKNIEELNPRVILKCDTRSCGISEIRRKFLSTKPEHTESLAKIQDELTTLLIRSVSKRIPCDGGKIGILFSGGIDSTLISFICKKLGSDFVCYTAVVDDPGMREAEDLIYAKRVARDLGFELRIRKVELDQVEAYLERVISLIEDTDVIKVGVGLTLYLACELAKEDGIKVIFSGLGAEELFAGYERHKHARNINDECLAGLLKIYERDTYRDDVITTNNDLALRLPFLDMRLVDYALKIPAEYKLKLNGTQNKVILRSIAVQLGIKREYANRKKRAAQYGSNSDKAISKLAKKGNYERKSEYLRELGCSFQLGEG
jgi:asparagine synthase (glutamine-hydrolysing)